MKAEMKPGRQPPAIFQQSRRMRRPRSNDTERVRALLNRLQKIVPSAPKDRQLPQVQVIQHVINYICQLQDQVVRNSRLGKLTAASETAREAGTPTDARTEAPDESACEMPAVSSSQSDQSAASEVTSDSVPVRLSPSSPAVSDGTSPV